MHKLILTFDIEDFINPNEIGSFQYILKILAKYNIKSILFVTGHMSEKLANYSEILDLMNQHEIGYHSSSHSVRPIIQEFTDVKSYDKAYSISLERETSHINPLTGKIEGIGGIYFLKDLFYKKRIETFRAPGMSWTPPHLEALTEFGIKFDFSSTISTLEPVQYNKMVFYPYAYTQELKGSLYDYQCFLYAVMKYDVAVFNLHPTQLMNINMWDNIYYNGNPSSLLYAQERNHNEIKSLLSTFEKLLKIIAFLKKNRLLEVNTNLNKSPKHLSINKNDVEKCYQMSARWPKKMFNYHSQYVSAHFQEFFESILK